MRIIFKGSKVVVYHATREEYEHALKRGLFVQSEGRIIDKEGREVIIVPAPFRAQAYIEANGPRFIAYGSVNATYSSYASTNWHVIANASTIKYCNGNNCIDAYPLFIFKPLIIPQWLYPLVYTIRRLIGFKALFASNFDYAILMASKDLGIDVKAELIYTAGTCSSLNETDCYGVALPIPSVAFNYNLAKPNTVAVGDVVNVDCTFWNYSTSGKVIDIGMADVYYNTGVATFGDAYLIKFTGRGGIAGCSGSPVYKTTAYGASVSINVKVVKVE